MSFTSGWQELCRLIGMDRNTRVLFLFIDETFLNQISLQSGMSCRVSWCWGKSQVREKLKLVGVQTCPNELDQVAWIDDVTLWPPAEFPVLWCIICKLQESILIRNLRPTKSFKRKSTLSVAESVATLYKINVEFCMLKAAVRLNQRLSGKPDHPWVCVWLKDGSWFCIIYCYYILIVYYIDILILYYTAILPCSYVCTNCFTLSTWE